ncbi:hypothetical protein BdWA1_000015 [Babesia duncani]|uniref:Uncharacterized protein n=1 Tax=Babesia duncani TaxID=323732 RepID=A0AAD9UPI6_9APIC|nr:hypothetical protein BdWA1_000015 [Babesia duncani]
MPYSDDECNSYKEYSSDTDFDEQCAEFDSLTVSSDYCYQVPQAYCYHATDEYTYLPLEKSCEIEETNHDSICSCCSMSTATASADYEDYDYQQLHYHYHIPTPTFSHSQEPKNTIKKLEKNGKCNSRPLVQQPPYGNAAALLYVADPKVPKKEKRNKHCFGFCGKAVRYPFFKPKYETMTSELRKGKIDIEVIVKPVSQVRIKSTQTKTKIKKPKLKLAVDAQNKAGRPKGIAKKRVLC